MNFRRKIALNLIKLFSAATITTLLIAQSAHATRFNNQFLEFELPPQWQCNLEGAEWVCQNTNDTRKKEAIIVFAAKLKGDQDSLDQYLNYLKAPKTYTSVQGKPVKSEPRTATNQNINGHPWVDALHLESELPGFYTRYLATVKDDIGVLVTYSVKQDKWQSYINDFDGLVRTLKVFRKQGLGLNANGQGGNIFEQTKIPTSITEGAVFNAQVPAETNEGQTAQGGKPQKQDNFTFYLIAGVAIAGIFIFLKKRNSG